MAIAAGDIFSIDSFEDRSEYARADYIEFIPMGGSANPMDDTMKLTGMESTDT